MVPTAELEALEPMTRSPSWWPGTRRPSASGGRWPMGTAPMILPRVSRRPRPRGVARLGCRASLGLGRALPDGVGADDLAAGLAAAAAAADVAARAQAGLQLALEPAAGV